MDLSIPYFVGLTLIGTTVYLATGWWIFRPVDLAARRHRGRIRFTLADFLCLFVTVQIPLGVVAWIDPGEHLANSPVWLILLCLTWIVPPVIWITAARAISRAGVPPGNSRLLFMGVVVPASYYGLLTFSISLVVCLHQMAMGDARSLLLRNRWPLSLAVILGCVLAVCGVLSRQVLHSKLRPAPPDSRANPA